MTAAMRTRFRPLGGDVGTAHITTYRLHAHNFPAGILPWLAIGRMGDKDNLLGFAISIGSRAVAIHRNVKRWPR